MSRRNPLVEYTAALAHAAGTFMVTLNPRCTSCGKVLAHYLTPPYAISCSRCGALNQTVRGESRAAAPTSPQTPERDILDAQLPSAPPPA